MKFPYLPSSHIDEAAHLLLIRAFGAEPAIPVDLKVILFDCLAEDESLAFNDEETLAYSDGDKILGSTYPVRGLIEICASLRKPHLVGRYRFTVAHELGHWVVHRPLYFRGAQSLDLFAAQETSDRLITLNRDVSFPSGRQVPREEWQANRFAARLLIPPTALATEFRRRFGTGPSSEIGQDGHRTPREQAIQLAKATTVENPISLCEAFEVSAEAMAIALEARRYVSEEPTLL